MTEFLRLLFAPCSEISRQTSRSLDEALPRSHRVAIRIHYLYCTSCRRYRQQIEQIRQALQAAATDQPGADALSDVTLSPAARERIKRSLTNR
ncbi:MAG: zf-HC2 domain-containing protein [Planctomycetes bacterium]|nr:zf-HC2 domain-containing protein [Planctomycetota bacterium]